MAKAESNLPETGLVRLPTILRHFPVSKSAWYRGVREGRYPQPVRLGPKTVAWRAEQVRELIEQYSERPAS